MEPFDEARAKIRLEYTSFYMRSSRRVSRDSLQDYPPALLSQVSKINAIEDTAATFNP